MKAAIFTLFALVATTQSALASSSHYVKFVNQSTRWEEEVLRALGNGQLNKAKLEELTSKLDAIISNFKHLRPGIYDDMERRGETNSIIEAQNFYYCLEDKRWNLTRKVEFKTQTDSLLVVPCMQAIHSDALPAQWPY